TSDLPADSPNSHQYLKFWRSEDGGTTWQKPVRVGPPQSFGVEAMHDTIIRTVSRRLVLPVYGYMMAPANPSYREPVLMDGSAISGFRPVTTTPTRASCGAMPTT